jgi:acetyl-CoA synthetase
MQGETKSCFAALARRSDQVANWLADLGVSPGDRVLIMLGNVRAVVTDCANAGEFAGLKGAPIRLSVGGACTGWRSFEESVEAEPLRRNPPPTPADAPMLLYFTSGTTAKAKLVSHSHTSSR